jgi:TatD DNase family protein
MLNNDRSRKTVAALPLDRLLTETDGPFTQAANRTIARPKDVADTVETLATVRSMSAAEMSVTIESNLRQLLQLDRKPAN